MKTKAKERELICNLIADVYQGPHDLDLEQKTNRPGLMEQQYKVIFDSIDSIILVLDNNGTIVDANSRMAELSGYEKEALIGEKITILSKIIKGENIIAALDNFDKKMAGVEVSPCEIEVIQDDNEPIMLEIFARHLTHNESIIGNLVVLKDITERKRNESKVKESYKKLQRTMEGAIEAIATIAETRDPYTAGHQRRVANLASGIAMEMELPEEQIAKIRIAGLLHDIGKVAVPAELLSKPGKLNKTEFDLIKMHPQLGREILKTMELPWVICPIVLQHHERLDGSGYPRGLTGDEISLEARILAVADVVEAMASHRPYRPSLGIEAALEEISNNKGRLYDTVVVEVCLTLFREKGFKFE